MPFGAGMVVGLAGGGCAPRGKVGFIAGGRSGRRSGHREVPIAGRRRSRPAGEQGGARQRSGTVGLRPRWRAISPQARPYSQYCGQVGIIDCSPCLTGTRRTLFLRALEAIIQNQYATPRRTRRRRRCSVVARRLARYRIDRRRALKPVTNQVTTPPGKGGRSATQPDAKVLLACGNRTQLDAFRRNWHAW
jgi:hypothetical protein